MCASVYNDIPCVSVCFYISILFDVSLVSSGLADDHALVLLMTNLDSVWTEPSRTFLWALFLDIYVFYVFCSAAETNSYLQAIKINKEPTKTLTTVTLSVHGLTVLQQINGLLGTCSSWYFYCKLFFYDLSHIKVLSVGINDKMAGFTKCQRATLCSLQQNKEKKMCIMKCSFSLMKLLRITSVVTTWNKSISHI